MKKERTVSIETDASDPEDWLVSAEGLAKALQGRRVRRLRHRLSAREPLAIAVRCGIPLANLGQYEIDRTPPLAVRTCLAVIERKPEATAAAYRKSQAA